MKTRANGLARSSADDTFHRGAPRAEDRNRKMALAKSDNESFRPMSATVAVHTPAEKPVSSRPSQRPRDSMRPSLRAMQSIVAAEDLSVVFQPIVDFHT